MIKQLLLALIALTLAAPAAAQNWNGQGATPVWDGAGVIGDGQDRVPEIFTAQQGGDPPATLTEPAVNDGTGYTVDQWTDTLTPAACTEQDSSKPHYGEDTGCRPWHGEDKFRTVCVFSHRAADDPVLFPGQPGASHLHDFYGNPNTDASSTFASLSVATGQFTCGGGPVNRSAYWHPTLLLELQPAVTTGGVTKPAVEVPVNSEGLAVYYNPLPGTGPKRVRLLRSLAFILGVNPADRLNTARQNELAASGMGWDTTDRHNGWIGWSCAPRSDAPPGTPTPVVQPGSTADINPLSGLPRQLQNADGSDPFGGTCEGSDKYQLIATLVAPDCWDGRTLTLFGNGRDHFRYPARTGDNSIIDACPRGSWRVPALVTKVEWPAYTAALRAKMHLSSDRMSSNPAQWQPNGSTMHADWLGDWNSVVFAKWQMNCAHITINGVSRTEVAPYTGRTCDTNIYEDYKLLKSGPSPNTALSRNPIVTVKNLGTAGTPSKEKFGKVVSGTVSATAHHVH